MFKTCNRPVSAVLRRALLRGLFGCPLLPVLLFGEIPVAPGQQSIRLKQPEVVRPQAVASILAEMWATERWKVGERSEREAIKLTIEDAQKEPKRLPVVPLIVLSAGEEIGWAERVPVGALKGQQLQKELAALSPLGMWRAVPGANHYIHLSQPAAVVNAIREVVQVTRAYKANGSAQR